MKKENPKPDTTLFDKSFDMINLAKTKGYVTGGEITPVMFEPWMNAPQVFCNTACAVVSMWLRERHIFPVVSPANERGQFCFFVASPLREGWAQPHSWYGHFSWEDAWLTAIHEALKLLPDDTAGEK